MIKKLIHAICGILLLTSVVQTVRAADTVWCDDALPSGASGFADGGDSWNWISSNPAPYSGSLAHQSALVSGLHEHYFTWATQTLSVNTGEVLYAYVYLDPTNPPAEIMLSWNDSAGSWEHRAYWGANDITDGTDGTASRYNMGALPVAGQWIRLQVPANAVNCEGVTLQGMSFACYNGRSTWDDSGKSITTLGIGGNTNQPTVWVDDALPAGASGSADGGDSWNWVSNNPTPYSGTLAHQSALVSGLHEHYFSWATQTLSVNTGDVAFAYVYLDPTNPPSEIMLSWNDITGSWEHRAYWGANDITYGTDATASRYNMGPLPAAGQWVALPVLASSVALEGTTLQGMSFACYNGRATWDYAGKVASTNSSSSSQSNTVTPPTISLVAPANGATVSGSAVSVSANASSTIGIASVQFTLDGANLGAPLTAPPYAGTWDSTTTANGSHALSAVATDTSGHQATAVAVTVTVNNTASTNINTISSNTNSTVYTNLTLQAGSVDYLNLQPPQVGSTQLRVLTPTLLELHLINSKALDPATVTNWNFVDSSFNLTLPALTKFAVTIDGVPAVIQSVGFKRRPLYAPLASYDLRIDNCIYLQLSTPVAEGQAVTVLNPDGTLWDSGTIFSASAVPLRYSPAIHVNQEGYLPSWPKKAIVGYYLGSMGEMALPTTGFSLVDTTSGATVFTGTMTLRKDVGYTYTPTPYQNVYEADFSSFTNAGEYYLVVPGMGASLPFLIDNGIAMDFARTYELGLFEQRSGYNVAMPYTRFTHTADHTAAALIPVNESSAYTFTWNCISNYAIQANSDNPAQTASLLTDPSKQLYPFVNQGSIDVSGGHFDAGDYSKYTWDMAQLVHGLMFAVDSLPGVAQLDNLGIPESGDGISDLMQEAKWESDCLAKLQDSDGGFYYVVYPQNSEYETTLPQYGSQQVVWPKNTASTAAGVAALAECASSPLFKQTWPSVASNYLAKAKLGWSFLTNAITKYGKAGAYQKMMHFGDDFTDQDDLAWAACEMFLATGDPSYQTTLESWFPDPTSNTTFLWGWWRMYGGWGNAVRDYAFAVKSGRLQASQLDANYLAKCITTITNCANDNLQWSKDNAYGSSFPDETKAVRGAGWYYSPEQAFNIVVGYQFNPDPAYLDAILRNVNYEGGCNPVNASYVTGLGWKRQRQLVDQYSEFDGRTLPKDGIPIGNIQQGFVYVNPYGSELTELCYPNDNASTAPYPYYDRWADAFNVTTEASSLQTAHSLDTVAWLAAQTPLKTQAWTYGNGQIQLPATPMQGQPVTVSFAAPGMDLSGARIVWEAQGAQPAYGSSFSFTPTNYGSAWIEAEAQWPDGRRVFAVTNLFAQNTLPTVTVAATTSTAIIGTTNYGVFTFTRTGSTTSNLVVSYNLSGTAVKWDDYYQYGSGAMPVSITIPAGSSSYSLVILARGNETGATPETVVLSLAQDPAYNAGSPYSATLTIVSNNAVTLPMVSITSPANSATVSGSPVTLSASASSGIGIASVQFNMDSVNLGAVLTAAPYTLTWDSTTVANGTHTLTAVATDTAGNQVASSGVTVTVNNTVPQSLPAVSVTATAPNASRVGPTNGVFTFTRTGNTNAALTVNYTLGGTATDGTDYSTLATSLTIPAGAASAALVVAPKSSTNYVAPETVVLGLSATSAYTIGATTNATATIAGNSVPSTIAKSGGNIKVTWNSVVGKTYVVAYKNSFSATTWTNLSSPITATGTTTSYVDTTASKFTTRYYTVYVTN